MITIVKGNNRIVCSYKTYEDQFKQLGYVPVSETKKATVKKVEPVVTAKIEQTEEKVAEPEKEVTDEEKIGSKYGVKRRTTSKKEGE